MQSDRSGDDETRHHWGCKVCERLTYEVDYNKDTEEEDEGTSSCEEQDHMDLI
jgi:hypothetical protein